MTGYEHPHFPRFRYRYGFTQSGPGPAPTLPSGKRVQRRVRGYDVTYVLDALGVVHAFIDGAEQPLSVHAQDVMLLGWPDA